MTQANGGSDLERIRARQEIMTRAAIVVALVFVVVTAAMAIWLGATIRQSTRLIEDCTISSGDCYKRGQAQTAKAIEQLQRIVLAANSCSSQLAPHADYKTLERCVIQALAAAERADK